MIGAIQQSLRYLFTAVLDPEQWGLDVPLPEQGSGKLEAGKRWRRSIVEIPVLKNQMRKGSDPKQIEIDYIFQYRAQFRFSGGLKYADLPTRKLHDILEYLNFLISTHPGLLSMSPTRIAEHLSWQYPKVDPCLYLEGSTDPQSNLTVRVVRVNGFIPVVEMENSDWLLTLVWSIESTVTGDINDFRRYFRSVLAGDPQINPRESLLGGNIDRLPYQISLGLWRDMPEVPDEPVVVLPTLTISRTGTGVTEGDTGSSPYQFSLQLSEVSAEVTSIMYRTIAGTATPGSDYTGVTGTQINLPAGSLSTNVSVQILGDLLDEIDESFTVEFYNPVGCRLPSGSAASFTAQIVDNDPLPIVSLSGLPTVLEGDSGATDYQITATLDRVSSRVVSVNYSVVDVTTDGSDFVINSGVITIAAGSLTQTGTIQISGDGTVELDEQFKVVLSNPVNCTINPAQSEITVTLTNDDVPPIVPVVSLSPLSVSQAEGTTGSQITLTVTLDQSTSVPVSVNYLTASGTAITGSDFLPGSGQVTVPAGSLSQTFAVTVLGDALVEGSESFTVSISNPVNCTINGLANTATVTLTNDDVLPVVSLSPITISQAEGNTGTINAVVTATLDRTYPLAVSVSFTTQDVSATAGSDYTLTSGTLTINPGQTTGTIQVPILGDATVESDEVFTASISSPGNCTINPGAATVTITITNDDVPPPVFNWALMPDVQVARRSAIEAALNTTTDPQGVFNLLASANFWLDGSGTYLSGTGTGALWNAAVGADATSISATNFSQSPGFVNVSNAHYQLSVPNNNFLIAAYNHSANVQTDACIFSARSTGTNVVPNSLIVAGHESIAANNLAIYFSNANKCWVDGSEIIPVPSFGSPRTISRANHILAGSYAPDTDIRHYCVGANSNTPATRRLNSPVYSLLGFTSEPVLLTQLFRFLNAYHSMGLTL